MQPEQKVNVLLVDDHPENLLALEAILDTLGQNLVKAHSGQEALRCLLNQDFAVILLDVQMPGMDGFETATLIRNRERSRHTPIIFLTAFSTSDNLVFKGYSLGAVDYLLKPIDPEILKSKVAVFVDLFKKTAEVKRQAAQLAAINAELRESEERFRSLSACSPVGIFMIDIEGRCTYINSRSQATHKFTLGESLTEGWSRSVHPEDRDWVLANWSAQTLKGQEYCHEFRLLTQEGVVRWVHVRSSPVLSDKRKLIGHVGTIEDITERKQAEEERGRFIREQEARQQAEAANRMKDEFLATLSHELRTPLNSMLGWARLLRTRKFDENTTARALETIERNAKSQAQLIEDILDVSRIIRGKLRLNLRPINLVPIIEATMDAVRPAAEDKSIQLELVVDRSVDLVSVDPDRLQQIVWNLLSNAIKFTPKGGSVEVRLERAGCHAQITVSDTGIGISPDFLPYIFDRFRQADSTTTRSYGGLGLGLAIVHHLVELHGGSIHANSAGEGQGATFTLKLLFAISIPNISIPNRDVHLTAVPNIDTVVHSKTQGVVDAQENRYNNQNTSDSEQGHVMDSNGVAYAEGVGEAIVNLPSLNSLQVLVVDDDTDTRDFLTTVLEQHGAKVTAVASVSEALEALQQLRLDVLVSDIGMPGEDGYELIRLVKALEAARGVKIPAIALTAYASGEERMRALSAGFQIHLPKPVEPAELIAVVANFNP